MPERIKSFCMEGQRWKIVSGGQHHTVALDSQGTDDFLKLILNSLLTFILSNLCYSELLVF